MNNKKFGQKIERKTKKRLNKYKIVKNIKKTINSGAVFGDTDFKSDEYCIESKGARKTFTITNKLLKKLWEQSLTVNKLPLLTVTLVGKDYEYFLVIYIERHKKIKKNIKNKTIKVNVKYVDGKRKIVDYIHNDNYYWKLDINIKKEM